MSTKRIPLGQLGTADLVVDAQYGSGSAQMGDEPIARLLSVGNMGGFRVCRHPDKNAPFPAYTVLFTDGTSTDWPDRLDPLTGRFSYYGDNREPGAPLHPGSKHGNELLRRVFDELHLAPLGQQITPFFVFERAGVGRDAIFRGLAVPGAAGVPAAEDLVAIWRTTKGQRFQNYRALFTILDVQTIPRAWLDELRAGDTLGLAAPAAWRAWATKRKYEALTAPATVKHRSAQQQLPSSPADEAIIAEIHQHFSQRPTDFEECAVEIWRLQEQNVTECQVTRAVVDGGRDAIGQYQVGPASDPVLLEFALEAKCYGAKNAVGTREVSRLISRIRHRQFGVLVTTSYLHHQAYKEIREDGHPIVVISAADIVQILRTKAQLSTLADVQVWLQREFPSPP